MIVLCKVTAKALPNSGWRSAYSHCRGCQALPRWSRAVVLLLRRTVATCQIEGLVDGVAQVNTDASFLALFILLRDVDEHFARVKVERNVSLDLSASGGVGLPDSIVVHAPCTYSLQCKCASTSFWLLHGMVIASVKLTVMSVAGSGFGLSP